MASSPKEQTPSNKKSKPTKGSARTDKKKRLTTTSIASITPVNLNSDSEEEAGMADEAGGSDFPGEKTSNGCHE